VRSITWSSNRGEIYLGDEEGIITIFNAKIGQSICNNNQLYLF
jgi:hypothetical protein